MVDQPSGVFASSMEVSAPAWTDIDEMDHNDPQAVTSYVEEIYDNCRQKEVRSVSQSSGEKWREREWRPSVVSIKRSPESCQRSSVTDTDRSARIPNSDPPFYFGICSVLTLC